MKIYYFIGRLLRPFARVSLYLYSFLLHVPRVRVVLMNEENEILLVQSWLSADTWELPGGGVHNSEETGQALLRELEEETGIKLLRENLQPLCTIRSTGHDEIAFQAFAAKNSLPSAIPNRFEIKAVAWFPYNAMPPVAPHTSEIMGKIQLS